MSAQDRQSDASSSGAHAEEKQRCCIGALYFSQALYSQGKNPVCAGVPRTLKTPRDTASFQSESVPGGSFKYVCIGVSLFDEERLRRTREEALKRSPTEPVELPYCEGLEIISAAELQENPVVLNGNVDGPAAAEASDRRNKRPGPLPPGGDGIRLFPFDSLPQDFPNKLAKSSMKVLNKMQENAILLPTLIKRPFVELYEVWTKAREVLKSRDKDR